MKYLVKVTYKAKDNNPNFAGQTQIYYSGKGEHSTEGNYSKWFVEWYGYSRPGDAKKNYHFKFPGDEIYWTKQVEIVEAV